MTLKAWGPALTVLDRQQRFAIFLKELTSAPPASNDDEALDLLARTLNAVEDAFSGVPMKPENYLNDGRLYPPQADSRRAVAGRTDLLRYRARRHNVWIAVNGALRIDSVAMPGEEARCFISKAGADGKTVRL